MIKDKQELIRLYNGLKGEYDKDLNSETLRKYNILSAAFKLGNKIYGKKFNTARLSEDFYVPYTTVKRILSLDKANKDTWKKIKEGKITSFKVAQVLLQNDIKFQDELIDLVIEKDLTTYQIKNMNDSSLDDIKSYRLRLAVEEGFARKDTAYKSMRITLCKLKDLLLLKVEHLPKGKIQELKENMLRVNQMLYSYINEIDKIIK